jgi:2-polyprenyl-6-methoxyphenol hydroxylase-like FAD-dependent oxidoreductase
MADARTTTTRCCVVGGEPAGMMLGYLLARAGAATTVLEKHADFLRDFRGDTVHPSTLRIMDERGLLDAFLQRPHRPLRRVGGWFGKERVQLGDFSGLPPRYAFVAMMPQWEFLDFLAAEARKLPAFRLRMRAGVGALIEAGGRVTGVRGSDADGAFEVRADCTFGCDGRHSTVRAAAGLAIEDLGAPIDASGSASAATRPCPTTASPASAPGTSSSPSTAATTGSAPTSSPRAAPTSFGAVRSRPFAPT